MTSEKSQIISMSLLHQSVYTPLNNRSTLPHSLSNAPTVELSSFQYNDQDILKITALYVNKAHGCDDILICRIKICD